MLARLGVQDRRELALLMAVVALVAISPLGNEGTHPLVLVIYRTLLIAITVGALFLIKDRYQEICPVFLILCAAVLVLMYVSLISNPGSRFNGLYYWYEHFLFGTAFLSLAAAHRYRNVQWKRTILWAVVAVDICYLTVALLLKQQPVIATFVNPNYFASFLLIGFAVSLAIALFEKHRLMRLGAAATAVLLYYGMTQAWSRGATIAAVGVTVLAIVRFGSDHGLSRSRLALIVVFVVAAGAIASPVLVRKFLDRGQFDPYNYQRPQLWLSAAKVIAERPLLGVGMGQFHLVSRKFAHPVDGTIARYMKRPGIAHNEYLQYAAESGIPAAVLLFSLSGYLIYLAARRARTLTAENRVFQEAGILTVAGLAAHALVDNNWTVPTIAACLVVFSTADILPLQRWRLSMSWTPRARAVCAIVGLLLVLDSVVIPATAIYFNESGHQAFVDGNLERAEARHRLSVAIAPEYEVFLDNTGAVYLEMYAKSNDTRWRNQAESFFSKAIAANPNGEQARRHMSKLLMMTLTGDRDKDQPIHHQLAVLDRQILEIDPFDPFIRKNLAEALYYSGKRMEAVRELERVIQLEPNFVPAYLRIADWLCEGGDVAGGDSYRQRAIEVASRFRNVAVQEQYEAMLLGRPDAQFRKP